MPWASFLFTGISRELETGRYHSMKISKHKKAVKIELISAVEQIQKGKALGDGAEGEVYRITPGVVAKVWHRNWFGKTDIKTLLQRFKDVENHLKTYPKWVKQPELLGYEQYNGIVITYHEYIPRTRNQKKYEKKFFMEADKGGLCDTHPANIIENKTGIYLVDVVVCKHRQSRKMSYNIIKRRLRK